MTSCDGSLENDINNEALRGGENRAAQHHGDKQAMEQDDMFIFSCQDLLYGGKNVTALTPCNDTLCDISDTGRQINSEEPFPFLWVLFLVKADPV